ncbi:ScbR family autoregulator-binding transcription factor [Streptomyces physcomitrii]|uniref:TetR/AcrR family transcriptional regulator n=1 Tax=Streptomyces physcomitrii TaxID=2724184 RepID=A0ABX1H8K3_9ACTN|nr:ScbR family autoregulator-binding transcription factor [Streptomyces physcomitrii]NKI44377.1 TetR/AcrR family transcriptional regulator [Streptomyces physcomitrii]
MALQERAERTRAKLIQAAATVFDEVGYQRATLMTISEQAKVTKGGLSFHFTTKAELGRAVQAEASSLSAAVLEDLAERQGPALEIVVEMTHALAELLTADVVVRAGTRLAQEFESPQDPALNAQVYWLSTLHRMLNRAVVDGSLAPGTDVRAATALIMSVTMGAERLTSTPYQWAALGRPEVPAESTQQWMSRMWRVLRPTLAAAPGPRHSAAAAAGGSPLPSGGSPLSSVPAPGLPSGSSGTVRQLVPGRLRG